MPSVPIRLLILIAWIATTSWLVHREIWPRVRAEPEGYSRLVGTIESPRRSEWDITIDGNERVGYGVTEISPLEDGSFVLRTSFDLDPKTFEEDRSGARISMRSELRLSAQQELESLSILMKSESFKKPLSIVGQVIGGELILHPSGLPLLPEEIRFPMKPNSVILDSITPVDRMPNLYQGKRWSTQSINPLAVATGPLGWLFAGNPMMQVDHIVTDTQLLVIDGKSWLCHEIEHRSGGSITRAWARVNDGLVLQREIEFGERNIKLTRASVPEELIVE